MSTLGSKSSTQRICKHRILKQIKSQINLCELEKNENKNVNEKLHIDFNKQNPETSTTNENNMQQTYENTENMSDTVINMHEFIGHDQENSIHFDESDSEEEFSDQENSIHFDESDSEEEFSEVSNESHESEEIDEIDENAPKLDEVPEITALRRWAVESRTSNMHIDSLLHILRQQLLQQLPKSAKTFLYTSHAQYKVHSMTDIDDLPGEFAYLGIKKGLELCVNTNLHNNNLIELDFNIDGVRLRKSSSKQLWPILCKIHYIPNIYKPFTVSLFYGNGKPKSLDEYMYPFVKELNELLSKGIIIKSKQFNIAVRSFICDTPARSFIKNVKGHMSFDGCERCKVKGEKIDNTVVFLQLDCEKRSDEQFRQILDIDHHNGPTPLLAVEPKIDLIKQFLLDPMHLMYLGIRARLFDFWMKGPIGVKLSAGQKIELNRRTTLIKKDIPEEFHRKMRSTDFYDKYKALEHKFFLNYCTPIVFKKLLNDEYYNHLVLLHSVCRLLSNKNATKYLNIAKQLLKTFVEEAKNLYGLSFISLNVHNLIHLTDDVEVMQSDLNSISAFDYENELGKIKHVLFSPHRTVAQYCRRLHTEREILEHVPELPKELRILKEHRKKGILSINYKQNYFSTKHPNNTAILHNKSIIKIHNILSVDSKIYLDVTFYKIKKSVYTSPFDSKFLNTFEVEEDRSLIHQYILLNEIESKLIKFSLNFSKNDPKRLFVIPLNH